MSVTTDPNDPRLTRGADTEPRPQADAYLVLSEAERARGFLRPLRDTYRHVPCGTTTTMAGAIAETYARDPWFYGGTYCVRCRLHRPLEEFRWLDGEPMAPAEWPAETLAAVMRAREALRGTA